MKYTAQQKYTEKLRKKGFVRVTVWCPAEDREDIRQIAAARCQKAEVEKRQRSSSQREKRVVQ